MLRNLSYWCLLYYTAKISLTISGVRGVLLKLTESLCRTRGLLHIVERQPLLGLID